MGRLRDIWRHWRRRKSRHGGRRAGSSTSRPPDAPLPVTLTVPRQGRAESSTIASRDELRALRSEFELLHRFAQGDSGDALRILESAARTGRGDRFVELRDCLREARQPGVAGLCRRIDELFPSLADELAGEVLAREARAFRANVLAALREAPVEGHLEMAASYALSADLRPMVAAGGQVRSASDTLMTQPDDTKKPGSPNDSTGNAASLEDALQAMESELQSLADIVSAPGVADEGLTEMLNGAPPEEPPVAEALADQTEESGALDDFEDVVDEVLLGEDAGADDEVDVSAPSATDSTDAATAEAAIGETTDPPAAEIPGADDESAPPEPMENPVDMAAANAEPNTAEVDALLASLGPAEEPLVPPSLLATDQPLAEVFDGDAAEAQDVADEARDPVVAEPASEEATPLEHPEAQRSSPTSIAESPPAEPTRKSAAPDESAATEAGWAAVFDDPEPASPATTPALPAHDAPRNTPGERSEARRGARPATGRSSRKSRGRGRRGEVEDAIANLAEFLQTEVGEMWEEARAALEDVVADANEVADLQARAADLHGEMQRMQSELAAARKESRLLQAQLLNLRDEVAQAKQRAEMSAFEAQSAADRAKAAAREAETTARFHRER